MAKPFAFPSSLSYLALKAFSLLDCKLLMIKPHLTSTDLDHQFFYLHQVPIDSSKLFI